MKLTSVHVVQGLVVLDSWLVAIRVCLLAGERVAAQRAGNRLLQCSKTLFFVQPAAFRLLASSNAANVQQRIDSVRAVAPRR